MTVDTSGLIFISYSSKDKDWVERLKAELDRFGIHTWLDRHNLMGGKGWEAQLEEALGKCQALFCVLTPNSMTSKWVAREVQTVHAQGKPIFVLEAEKTTLPDALSFLGTIQYTPFTESFDEGVKRLLYALPLELRQAAFEARLAELPLDEIPDPAPLPKGSNLPPFPHNPYFVGRVEELRSLTRALKGGPGAVVGQAAAMIGMGGIGKTQLASEFVHRYGQFFLGGVFWFSFAEAATVPAQVAASGGKPGLDLSPGWEALDEAAKVRQVRAAWQSPIPRLLVFDNCESLELLERWRPPSGGCRVLVTSRKPDWPGTLGLANLPIRTLPRPESIALLRKFRPDLAADDPGLEEIAEALGDLPLALHIAGSSLAADFRHLPLEDYLAELCQPDLLETVLLLEEGHSPTWHDQHVGRTFALSLARLDPESEDGRLGLALLARAAEFAPGIPVPRSLLRDTLDEKVSAKSTEGGLRRLLAVGLIEEGEDGALTVHRLVAGYARGTLTDGEALSDVVGAVIGEVYRANMTGLPGEMLAVLPHMQFLVEGGAGREDEQAATLLINYGYYLKMTGDYPAARPYYEQALAIKQKVLGEEHPDTATSLNNLGFLLRAMGDYPAARPYYEQALAILEKTLGGEHPTTRIVRGNLAYLEELLRDSKGQ